MVDRAERRKVILIGMMGCGKTTVGRLVAQLLSWPFVDLDEQVEALAGCSITAIFQTHGEPHFRRLESEVLRMVLSSEGPAVVAAGGGTALESENARAMRAAGDVFWLTAGCEEIERRMAGSEGRPLWNPEKAREMLAARERHYLRASDAAVDTAGRAAAEVAAEIVRLRQGTGVLRTVEVHAGGVAYPIVLGRGLLSQAGRLMPEGKVPGHALVVSNDRVAPLYMEQTADGLRRAGVRVSTYVLPDGEEHKNLTWLQRLYDWGLSEKADRQSVVVALGGGVVGDLAGFFAATLMRGLRFVQIPTTVMAQVDSSIGGKTAVNHALGKNLIGAFHHPSIVICDLDALATLPRREIANGMAEMVKHAAIHDEKYFTYLEEKLERLLNIERLSTLDALARSCQIKAEYVGRDPRDRGERAALNFGHTTGHALEVAAGYGRYRHGEAVSLGMVAAAMLSERLGMMKTADRVRLQKLLQRAGLPVSLPAGSADRIIAAAGHDKKAEGGCLRWVLLRGLGCAAVMQEVPPTLWREVLEEMSAPDSSSGD